MRYDASERVNNNINMQKAERKSELVSDNRCLNTNANMAPNIKVLNPG